MRNQLNFYVFQSSSNGLAICVQIPRSEPCDSGFQSQYIGIARQLVSAILIGIRNKSINLHADFDMPYTLFDMFHELFYAPSSKIDFKLFDHIWINQVQLHHDSLQEVSKCQTHPTFVLRIRRQS